MGGHGFRPAEGTEHLGENREPGDPFVAAVRREPAGESGGRVTEFTARRLEQREIRSRHGQVAYR